MEQLEQHKTSPIRHVSACMKVKTGTEIPEFWDGIRRTT